MDESCMCWSQQTAGYAAGAAVCEEHRDESRWKAVEALYRATVAAAVWSYTGVSCGILLKNV